MAENAEKDNKHFSRGLRFNKSGEASVAHFGGKKDLFGFIDILAVDPREKLTIAIQATSFGNRLARIKKICGEKAAAATIWLTAGNKIEVWGWRKVGHRWAVTICELGLVDGKPALYTETKDVI